MFKQVAHPLLTYRAAARRRCSKLLCNLESLRELHLALRVRGEAVVNHVTDGNEEPRALGQGSTTLAH